jgi:hypothetical protein
MQNFACHAKFFHLLRRQQNENLTPHVHRNGPQFGCGCFDPCWSNKFARGCIAATATAGRNISDIDIDIDRH